MGAMRVAAAAMVVLAVVAGADIEEENPSLPDIWKVVENSYEAFVSINFPDLHPGATMIVNELYDISEEKGMVQVWSDKENAVTNYYTKSQQAFYVNGQACTVGMIMEVDHYKLWGWIYDDSYSSEGNQNFLYGPSALLRIPKDFGRRAVYGGVRTVRNIEAEHWTIDHPEGYMIDYYFATDQWLMPFGHEIDGIGLRAPLLVMVYGLHRNPWNTDEERTNQTIFYEYTGFDPAVKDEWSRKFLVKEGVDCKGRVSLDPDYLYPPNAPSQFQTFVETIVRMSSGSEESTIIYRSWLYYSNWMQLIRVDVNPGENAAEAIAAYKSIHDYNTGIEYRIDMETGNCDMRALDPNELGNQIGSGAIAGVIMANPNQMFHLDDKYVFNGFSETRGIKTTRWTAVRDDIYNPNSGENYKKVVVDYHFNSKEVLQDGEAEGATLPLRVDATVYFDNNTNVVFFRDTLNMLHMETSFQEYDFNPFHVGECMDLPTERTWLKITFEGDWMDGASQMPDAFKKLMIQYVADKTHSSYIRFPEVQLDHDMDGLVYGTMLILEPAPYHLQFNQLADRIPTDFDTKMALNIHGVDECAYLCLSYQKFVCKSFYKCKGDGRTCYVSNYQNSAGNNLNIDACPHYNKALLTNSTMVQKPNSEVEVIIGEKIVTGDFTIELDYTDFEGNPQKGTYRALAEQEQIIGDDPVFTDLVRDDFYLAYKRGKLVNKYTDLRVTDVSYASCAAKCLGQVSFDCETFSYCYDSRLCLLSSEVVDAPPEDNQISRQSDCVIIIRAHTNDYTPLEGFVYLGEAKANFTSLTAENCAFHCDNATDFTCRSFDFCVLSLSCHLYDHHTADAPDSMFNASSSCIHYSRNALVDFTKHANQKIDGTRDEYIKATTPAACAQACEDQPDFECNGFDYCEEEGSTVTCFLTKDHYSDDGTVISDSLTCDHYSRDYYEGQDWNHYSHNRNSKYIYGPGDMAGLACGMLVVSIALTFAGVYGYNKWKK